MARDLNIRDERGNLLHTTNFDQRISKQQAEFLLKLPTEYLTFEIMCKEYGDDDDWVGLCADDLNDDGTLDDDYQTFELWHIPQYAENPLIKKIKNAYNEELRLCFKEYKYQDILKRDGNPIVIKKPSDLIDAMNKLDTAGDYDNIFFSDGYMKGLEAAIGLITSPVKVAKGRGK